jgi:hypothetical protein
MQCRREDDPAPSDLDRMAAYHFGQLGPGQVAGFGPAWLRSAASARIFFFSNPFYYLLQIPTSLKIYKKIICIQI